MYSREGLGAIGDPGEQVDPKGYTFVWQDGRVQTGPSSFTGGWIRDYTLNGSGRLAWLMNGTGVRLPDGWTLDPISGNVAAPDDPNRVVGIHYEGDRVVVQTAAEAEAQAAADQSARDAELLSMVPGTILAPEDLEAAARLGIPLVQRNDGQWLITDRAADAGQPVSDDEAARLIRTRINLEPDAFPNVRTDDAAPAPPSSWVTWALGGVAAFLLFRRGSR